MNKFEQTPQSEEIEDQVENLEDDIEMTEEEKSALEEIAHKLTELRLGEIDPKEVKNKIDDFIGEYGLAHSELEYKMQVLFGATTGVLMAVVFAKTTGYVPSGLAGGLFGGMVGAPIGEGVGKIAKIGLKLTSKFYGRYAQGVEERKEGKSHYE